MKFKVSTQNGLPVIQVERQRKLIEWQNHCNELEATLGKCTPSNAKQYEQALEDYEKTATNSYPSIVTRKWPTSHKALKELLEETGANVLCVEFTDDGLIGVVYV